MAIRNSMTRLIRKMRQLGQAGMEDYTVVDEVYWSDEHIQDILDSHRNRVEALPLLEEPVYISGTNYYLRYKIPLVPRRFGVEGTAEGTGYFRIADSTGATISGAAYAFDDNDYSVTFTADTEGSARYYSGYAYDLPAAAVELWQLKSGHAWSAINFSADGHRFDRGQLHDHCLQMVKLYSESVGAVSTRMKRTDTHGPGDGEHF